MERAIRRWSARLDAPLDEAAVSTLVKRLSKSYVVYGTLLLLPPNTKEHEAVRTLLESECALGLYEHIAGEMKVTHIAVNRPIPPSASGQSIENVLRAPIHFEPVYGDFGPSSCNTTCSEQDCAQAYWVTAKQNGIAQVWAPRWTMFSRGNVKEKARLLDLESVRDAVSDGRQQGTGSCVVDLYAGIGYFTFSYLQAGFAKAICWELNPWSCEGMRRGLRANKWTARTYTPSTNLQDMPSGPEQVLIFNETNELALDRLQIMRASLPPIRHVNCGFLPTTRASWVAALGCLDTRFDGWLHLHENFGVSEIEARAEDVRLFFQSKVDGSRQHLVILEHIVRVKSYAPDVWHCVLDIRIPARDGSVSSCSS